MVKYEELGYKSIEEYDYDFLNNLLTTNHTYEFFTNQEKVLNAVKKLNSQIDKLNPLTKVAPENLEKEFLKTIGTYPETKQVLPLILAIREKKFPIMNIDKGEVEEIDFSKNSKDIEKITTFSKNSGIFDFFLEINDLKSYLLGVEVGLDTNARKNRSGHSFERIVSNFLDKSLKNHPTLTYEAEYTIKLERNKRFDFVIFENEMPKIVFECNFYSATGSKPIEVAHAYVELQKQVKKANMKFVWITDGLGWKNMFNTLKSVSPEIDFILNYEMLEKTFDDLLKI